MSQLHAACPSNGAPPCIYFIAVPTWIKYIPVDIDLIIFSNIIQPNDVFVFSYISALISKMVTNWYYDFNQSFVRDVSFDILIKTSIYKVIQIIFFCESCYN